MILILNPRQCNPEGEWTHDMFEGGARRNNNPRLGSQSERCGRCAQKRWAMHTQSLLAKQYDVFQWWKILELLMSIRHMTLIIVSYLKGNLLLRPTLSFVRSLHRNIRTSSTFSTRFACSLKQSISLKFKSVSVNSWWAKQFAINLIKKCLLIKKLFVVSKTTS